MDAPVEPALQWVSWFDLEQQRIFVPWKLIVEHGKARKFAWSPRAPWRHFSFREPLDWVTLAEAGAEIDQRNPDNGIGLVFTRIDLDGQKLALCCIDQDACISPNGTVISWANELTAKLHTYTETSPSGEGRKSFFVMVETHADELIQQYMGNAEKVPWPMPAAPDTTKSGGGKLELFCGMGYGTVTTELLEDQPDRLRLISYPEVAAALRGIGIQPKTRTEGRLLNAEIARQDPLTSEQLSTVEEIITAIPPEDYKEWFEVGAALFNLSGGTDAGLQIFDAWSAKATTPNKYLGTEDVRKQWNHYENYNGTRVGLTRIKSYATKYGWREPIPANMVVDDEPVYTEENPRPLDTIIRPPYDTEEETVPYISGAGADRSDTTIAQWMAFAWNDGGMNQTWRYWVDAETWMRWDGRGWEQNDKENTRVRRKIESGLAYYTNERGMDWRDSHRVEVNSERKLNSVKSKLEAHLALGSGQVSQSTGYLQTPDGMYDLMSGKLVKMNDAKEMYEIRYTTTGPVFGQPTPLFDKLIAGLAEDDPEVIEWLWHYIAYAIIGEPTEDCFLVIWGPGGNGKTRFVNVLLRIFGQYAITAKRSIFTEDGKQEHDTNKYQLKGKRLGIVTELSAQDKWDDSFLKQVTGGDMIVARAMRQDAEAFRPEIALLMICNELPDLRRVTEAFRRRFRMIGTTRVPKNPDGRLERNIIQYESMAILGRIIEYCRKLLANGEIQLPPVPRRMLAAANEALADQDPFYEWLVTCCEHGKDVMEDVEFDVLKKHHDAWQRANHGTRVISIGGMTEADFIKKLRANGCERKRKRKNYAQIYFVQNIRLKTAAEMNDNERKRA